MCVVHVAVPASQPAALALPPQARGDAAHLTLMMAQVYGATLAPPARPGAVYERQAAATHVPSLAIDA
jgi:hypothetical protein